MNVLCATDGSGHARWALEAIQDLCRLRSSSLLLVHVLDSVSWAAARSHEVGVLELPEDHGEALLKEVQATSVSRHWGAAQLRVMNGRPAEAILQAAARCKSDIVVIGSRGLTDPKAIVLGSVSTRVAIEAPCSVLVVKQAKPDWSRIVFGADGSHSASGAVRVLGSLSFRQGTEVLVVSVIPPLPTPVQENAELPNPPLFPLHQVLERQALDTARQAAARLTEQGMKATPLVAHGHPAAELIRVAESASAGLVVVGTRTFLGVRRQMMGRVADTTVMFSKCSVLVCR